MIEIIQGDCLEEMKKMENNSIDFIVTDPPYGLKFMNKTWDHGIPGIPLWTEALRICKPGSMLAAFGGTRTQHRLTCAIEDAGWEIRDVIMWLYGSGFPKSHNHFGLEGYGTALKPAYEPIVICMKPCDGTFAQNAQKWGLSGINIEDCRVKKDENDISGWSQSGSKQSENRSMSGKNYDREPKPDNAGRWPSNLILDEEAAEILDQQSGVLKSGEVKPYKRKTNDQYSGSFPDNINYFEGSIGGASRFFYCAKASSCERNRGLDKPCSHPTVKPISLMKYILKLLAPPGDPICLDPFAGSGSTLIAAKELGIRCIGIEKESEYCEIARKRLESVND